MKYRSNHRTPLLLALVLGLSLGAAGCDQQGDKTRATPATAAQGEVIATVNGEPITEGQLAQYQGMRPDGAQMQDPQALLDELITQQVIYQQALRQGLDKDPEIIQELELHRLRVLVSAAVRKAINDNPLTDEQLREEYESLKSRMVMTEYKASHILVKEEELARKLIEELDQGADFAQLAGEHSTDTSAANGGDLGWFNPQQMVAPFSLAVSQLEKGSYTPEPVQTQFGWHIIKLEDSRQPEPPAFEMVRNQLEQMMQQRQVSEYIEGLREAAAITIKGDNEGEGASE